MKIINFIISSSAQVLPLPLVLYVCDQLVTTFIRIAFGSTNGFFLPRPGFIGKDGTRKSAGATVREFSSGG